MRRVGGWIFLSAFVGYLAGSVPFSLLIARAHSVDLRTVGSGNVGATNVWRSVGRSAGLFAFLCDLAKGFLPVHFFLPSGLAAGLAAATGAVAGHSFSVFLRGRGGKGVATGCGVFLALAPIETLGALAIFAVVGPGITRTVSAGSVAASIFLPVALLARRGADPVALAAGAIGILIVVRHRANLARLRAGTENKIR